MYRWARGCGHALGRARRRGPGCGRGRRCTTPVRAGGRRRHVTAWHRCRIQAVLVQAGLLAPDHVNRRGAKLAPDHPVDPEVEPHKLALRVAVLLPRPCPRPPLTLPRLPRSAARRPPVPPRGPTVAAAGARGITLGCSWAGAAGSVMRRRVDTRREGIRRNQLQRHCRPPGRASAPAAGVDVDVDTGRDSWPVDLHLSGVAFL